MKCSGERPTCSRCSKAGKACEYYEEAPSGVDEQQESQPRPGAAYQNQPVDSGDANNPQQRPSPQAAPYAQSGQEVDRGRTGLREQAAVSRGSSWDSLYENTPPPDLSGPSFYQSPEPSLGQQQPIRDNSRNPSDYASSENELRPVSQSLQQGQRTPGELSPPSAAMGQGGYDATEFLGAIGGASPLNPLPGTVSAPRSQSRSTRSVNSGRTESTRPNSRDRREPSTGSGGIERPSSSGGPGGSGGVAGGATQQGLDPSLKTMFGKLNIKKKK